MSLGIVTAEQLFLDDISADDYQAEVADHEIQCSCQQCQVFDRLVELEQAYARYLTTGIVSPDLKELVQKKYERFS